LASLILDCDEDRLDVALDLELFEDLVSFEVSLISPRLSLEPVPVEPEALEVVPLRPRVPELWLPWVPWLAPLCSARAPPFLEPWLL